MVGALACTLAFVAAGVAALVAGPAAPAAAGPVGACSASGVLVVVDFGHWGGPTDVGCAPASGTGYDAMTTAGFITAGTQADGPAFVCRIGLASQGTAGLEPTPAEDPCVDTPPVSAYWSYWHAQAGQGTWSYSQQGVMSYRPSAGSIDAWVFGATDVAGTTGQPPFSPAQVRAAAPSGGSGPVALDPRAATPGQASAPPGTGASATGSPAEQGGGVTPSAPGTPTGAGSGPGGSRPATSSPGATGPVTGAAGSTGPAAATGPGPSGSSRPAPGLGVVAAAGGGTRRSDGSSGAPLAFAAGLVAVAVVGALGAVTAWRRRRTT